MVNTEHSTGTMHRGWQLGKLGLSLTGSYLGYQIQNIFLAGQAKEDRKKSFRRQISRHFREELQSLKGPVMKVGQMLSMQSQILPEEALTELSALQMKAPAMHPSLARAQFKASQGRFPEEVFRQFDPEPFAAASLGQVHKAVTKQGETVVVKIQYPAIKKAIENDFKLLKSVTLPMQLSGHVPASVIDEVEKGVLKETDYMNEGRNLDFFGQRLAPLDFVRVPKVYWNLTTDRVLTMSHVDGVSLSQFIEQKPTPALSQKLGQHLLELFFFQIFELYAFHADPHPGNYLIDEEGNIGLVDFGCVKTFTPEFITLIRCFQNQSWRQGKEQIDVMLRLIWGAEILEKRESAFRVLKGMIELYDQLFPPPGQALGTVDFRDNKIFDKIINIRKEALAGKLAQPEFPFYARAEIGLYNHLHNLGAQVDVAALAAGMARNSALKNGVKKEVARE